MILDRNNPKSDLSAPSHSVSLAYVLAILSALLIAFIAFSVFQHEKESLLKQGESELEAVADLKAEQIVNWINERKADVFVHATHTGLADSLVAWLKAGAPKNGKGTDRVGMRMATIKAAYRYDALLVLDKEGLIRLSTSDEHGPVDEKFRQFSLRAMNEQTAQLYDLNLDASGKPTMGVIMPLRDQAGTGDVVGALYARINPATFLYPLMQSWPVPSETAEILIVRREGEQVLFLNELRHSKHAALTMRLPLSTPGLPAANLLGGRKNGLFHGKDYRGHDVISYLLQVPGTNWGMVAKVDKDEIFRPMRQQSAFAFGGLLLWLLIVATLWNYLRSRKNASMHFKERLKSQALAQRYELLSKYANDMIFLMEGNGRIVDANNRAVEVYGYSLEEMRQMNARDFRSDSKQGEFFPDWEKLRKESSLVFETEHRCKDGTVLQIEASVQRFSTEGDEYVQGILRDISERKKIEKSLIESEKKFRHLFEYSADPALLLKDGHFIDCNAATLTLLGYASKAAFIDSSPGGISPPYQPDGRASSEKSAEMDATALREGFNRFEWMHLRLDGSEVPVEVTLTPITVEGEQILHVLWRDITGRKQDEDRLRTLSLVVEQSPNSIVIADLDAKIQYVNQAFIDETGYSLDEVIGKNPRLLNSGKNPKSTYREMWSCLTRGETWKGELVNRRKDGSEYVESVLISPVFQAEGSGAHYVSIKENITGRKQNEAQIERLGRVYHLLSKVNETIVRTRDRNSLFTAICEAASASGLFRFAWIGMLDKEKILVTPVAYAGVEEGYTQALHIRLDDERVNKGPTATAIRENAHLVCQDIENDPRMAPWRHAALARGYRSSCVIPVHEAGAVAGTINVYASEADFFTPDIVRLMLELAADISFSLDVFREKEGRELAEQEIRRMNLDLERRVQERTLQLEAANKELEAFSYSVSHDLRAPLRSIDGFSQVLLKNYIGQLDAKGQDYLERVRRASQRMGELIDDMLYLSRVTRSEIDKKSLDLSQVARQIATSLKDSAPDRRVEFVIEDSLWVKADAKLLHIVLENLLGNAWKFTSKKPEARIELGMVEQSGTGVLFVRDNGAGFNMDYAHKLFNPFQRLHGMNDFEGTGIGLATVHRIIQRHGGRIWVEAQEGQGATFFFTCANEQEGATE